MRLVPPHLGRWLFVLVLFQIGFGIAVALGSAFEVLNLLDPSLFPEAQENPIMRLHHSIPIVNAWTLGSNAVTVLLGIGFAFGGIGLLRRRAPSLDWTRLCAMAMLAVSAGGAVVCGIFLVPPLLRSYASPAPDERTLAVILLVSIAATVLFLPILPGAMLVAYRCPGVRARFGK